MSVRQRSKRGSIWKNTSIGQLERRYYVGPFGRKKGKSVGPNVTVNVTEANRKRVYHLRCEFEGFLWGKQVLTSQLIRMHSKLRKRITMFSIAKKLKGEEEVKAFFQHFVQNFHFPKSILFSRDCEQCKLLVQAYFDEASRSPLAFTSNAFCELLGVSSLSFGPYGDSQAEGYVDIRKLGSKGAADRLRSMHCCCMTCYCICHKCIFRNYEKVWYVVKPTCVVFLAHPTSSPSGAKHVVLFDTNFEIENSVFIKRLEKPKLTLTSPEVILQLRFGNLFDRRTFQKSIKSAFRKSVYSETYPHHSSMPVREARADTTTKAISSAAFSYGGNAATCWEDVYNAINTAKYDIFICGWWVCPNLHLRRPCQTFPESRLDVLLKKKANEGCKIYVQLFKEFFKLLPLDNEWTKDILRSTHPNVKVMRHPAHFFKSNSVLRWSHHEKVIVIDQCVAFVGGLDLCYGRYDDKNYHLFEAEHRSVAGTTHLWRTWKDKDYNNVRIKDFVQNREPGDLIDRSIHPRMPWRDVHALVVGYPAIDLARHCIQRWNFTVETLAKREKLLIPREPMPWLWERVAEHSILSRRRDNSNTLRRVHGMKGSNAKRLKANSPSAGGGDINFDNMLGTLNVSLVVEDSEDEDDEGSPAKNQDQHQNNKIEAATEFKTIEQDEHSTDSEADDIARIASTSVYVSSSEEESISSGEDYIPVVHAATLKSKSRRGESSRRSIIVDMKAEKADDSRTGGMNKLASVYSIPLSNPTKISPVPRYSNGNRTAWLKQWFKPLPSIAHLPSCYPTEIQLLRSSGRWSNGRDESSIQAAYCHLIKHAERYIYIENQFFISGGKAGGKNCILDALVMRIIRAFKARRPFKVYIFLPLFPGMEGPVDSDDAKPIRIIMYLQYSTIVRGKKSLYSRLHAAGVDCPESYLRFYSLRTWEMRADGLPVTEMVYIHSKCIIVDDQAAVIGSANINDRSMVGNHDSEVAYLIRDTDEFEEIREGSGNRGKVKVGKFCRQLRDQLLADILGPVPGFNTEDLASDTTFDSIYKIASLNTSLYDAIFKVIPSNNVQSLETLKRLRTSRKSQLVTPDTFADRDEVLENDDLLSGIRGLVVVFPLDFLKESHQDLCPGVGQRELRQLFG